MHYAFDIILKNRKILNSFLMNFSLEELNIVPEGFSNNIIWNIAHVVVTQQLLVYNLSGLPMHTNDEMVAKYRKGSKVEKVTTQDEVNQDYNAIEVKDSFGSEIDKDKMKY